VTVIDCAESLIATTRAGFFASRHHKTVKSDAAKKNLVLAMANYGAIV
jgi:hypothetical protein